MVASKTMGEVDESVTRAWLDEEDNADTVGGKTSTWRWDSIEIRTTFVDEPLGVMISWSVFLTSGSSVTGS